MEMCFKTFLIEERKSLVWLRLFQLKGIDKVFGMEECGRYDGVELLEMEEWKIWWGWNTWNGSVGEDNWFLIIINLRIQSVNIEIR